MSISVFRRENMNKIFYTLTAISASLLIASCEEWEPVFTGDYGKADVYKPETLTPTMSILELKSLYEKSPVYIDKDIIIGGQVVSEDKSGNIYKSLYIQDATSGIELKLGKSGLYNDYKLGQWIYVKCSGLTLGAYSGMLQLGYEDPSGEYETSYIDVQYLIDNHIIRGELGEPVQAKVVSEKDLKKAENLGCYVELKGLQYADEIFCLVYVDQNRDKKTNSNRIFFSGKTWGIDSWAMSKQGYIDYLNSGVLDSGKVNDGSATVAQIKDKLISGAVANSVSQYFRMGSTSVQIRTSGYAKFADTKLDRTVAVSEDASGNPVYLNITGGSKIDVKGILTVYNGSTQFTLISQDGVSAAAE